MKERLDNRYIVLYLTWIQIVIITYLDNKTDKRSMVDSHVYFVSTACHLRND